MKNNFLRYFAFFGFCLSNFPRSSGKVWDFWELTENRLQITNVAKPNNQSSEETAV